MGRRKKHIVNTFPEDGQRRAVYHFSLLEESVDLQGNATDADFPKSPQHDPEIKVSKQGGVERVQVGEVTTQDGQIEEYVEKGSGGFLPKHPGVTNSEIINMIQGDDEVFNHGIGSPSVHASAMQCTGVKASKAGAPTMVAIELEASEVDEEAFTRHITAKHQKRMTQSSLTVDFSTSKQSLPEFPNASFQAKLSELSKSGLTKHQQLSIFRHLGKAVRSYRDTTVPALRQCLDSPSGPCRDRKMFAAVCNLLGMVDTPKSQRALLGHMSATMHTDFQAIVTGLAMSKEPIQETVQALQEVSQKHGERGTEALLALGTLISNNHHGELQWEAARDIVTRLHQETSPNIVEDFMDFLHNARLPNMVRFIQPHLNSVVQSAADDRFGHASEALDPGEEMLALQLCGEGNGKICHGRGKCGRFPHSATGGGECARHDDCCRMLRARNASSPTPVAKRHGFHRQCCIFDPKWAKPLVAGRIKVHFQLKFPH